MKALVALLLLLVAGNAIGQPIGGGTGGGNINNLSQIQISACADTEILAYSASPPEWVCATNTAGSGAALDLADNGSNESIAIGEIATTGDTNSIFTEPSANKLLIDLGLNWPSADTADALSANGANCAAGEIPLGVDEAGAVEGCYPAPTGGAALDLTDNGSNESAAIGEIATTGDTNSIFTEPAPDKLLINLGLNWPSADTADALSANGANCPEGQIPLGVDASGAVEGCYASTPGAASILDLGDDGADESIAIGEIATTGDTNSIFTEPAPNKLLIDLGLNWPSADTADALSANGANCAAGEIPLGVDEAGAVEGCYPAGSGSAATLTLADTTPEVTMQTRYYECADTTSITDFVDSDGDHTDFNDFWIHITALDECILDFTSGVMEGNKGAAWVAAIGDTATCYFSVGRDGWSCLVSDPDGAGAFDQENATIVAPAIATTEWTRVCGDSGCVAIGSTNGGTVMGFDLDNDQAADCTLSKSAGVSTFNCSNTNFAATPGQTAGDIIFNKSDGTACLTLDPDDGEVTQGTTCSTIDYTSFLTGRVVHGTDAQSTRTLSGAQCRGSLWKANHSVLERFTLCAAQTGGGQFVCFEDWSGNGITVDPAGTETIRLATGTVLTAGNSIDLEPGIGNAMCLFSDSATAWHVLPGAIGAIADGGT